MRKNKYPLVFMRRFFSVYMGSECIRGLTNEEQTGYKKKRQV